MNYFALLNIAPTFDIDLKTLESAYFKAQRQYHPDRFVGKSPAERQAALQRSVDINQAYECLKTPLTRAQYLLSLQGILVGTEHDSIKPSYELLTEIMELREQIEAGRELIDSLNNMRKISLQNIASYYTNVAWEKMAQETIRLGYLEKMREESKHKK